MTNIPTEAIEYLRDPQSEKGIVKIVKQYLLTTEQKQWLFENDLSVSDLLTGEWHSCLIEEIEFIFREWNTLLGEAIFEI